MANRVNHRSPSYNDSEAKVFQSSLLRISIPDEEPNKVLETADLVNLSEACVRCG